MMYFIPYQAKANVDFPFIFCLYRIATKDQKEKLKNVIEYNSLRELAETIKSVCGFSVSASTISRILNKEDYKPFLEINKEQKRIIIKNDFRNKTKTEKRCFITLTEKEMIFLIEQNNNLLCKYFLSLKYYCGISGVNTTSTTAEQLLSTLGYSVKSGKTKGLLCSFNCLLCENGFLKIDKIRLNGKERNIYHIQDI